MNLTKKFCKVFFNNRFMQGVMLGLMLHKSYVYIQGSIYSDISMSRYDKNGDGKISTGEIIDGLIDDLSHINKNAHQPFDPKAIFYLKKENTYDDKKL